MFFLFLFFFFVFFFLLALKCYCKRNGAHKDVSSRMGLAADLNGLIYLNAKETQPFSIQFFFHMAHMRLISELYPVFLCIE